MLFSVIISTFNRAQFIGATLDSVQEQEFRDYEVIVVDDGSTDETPSILQEYKGIRVLRQSNRGPGAARNYGVSRAQGDYIAFLDSDDLWFPWTLSVFAALIREKASPSILSAKTFEFGQDAELASIGNERPRAEYFDDYYTSAWKHHWVGVGTSVIQREQFLKVGGITEKRINAEDHDLVMRLGTTRGFVQVQSPYTLAYRRQKGGETNSFANTYSGIAHLIRQEEQGNYPGGAARLRERWEILTL